MSMTWSISASASPEEAERLFDEGKKLLAEHKYDEACRLLARSEEMDPADGTLLALGLCHEQAGWLVAAFGELSEVLRRSIASGREDRQRVARSALARITPRVGRLTIRLDGGGDGLVVTNDGVAVPLAALGREAAVDPGVHTIELRRGGAVMWTSQLGIAAGSSAVVVVPIPKSAAPDVVAVAPPRADDASHASMSSTSSAGAGAAGAPWYGYAIGGVGLGVLAVGGVFGLRSFTQWSDVRRQCDPSACTDPGAGGAAASAEHSATAANILITSGLVLVATSVVILLWPRSSSSSASATMRAPALTSMGTSRASFTTTF